MKNSGEYTPRVTRGEDGAYRWTCRISREQHRHGLRVTMIVVGALCLLLVILGAMLDRQVFLITLLSCGALGVISEIWGVIEGIQILTGSINTDGKGIPLKD